MISFVIDEEKLYALRYACSEYEEESNTSCSIYENSTDRLTKINLGGEKPIDISSINNSCLNSYTIYILTDKNNIYSLNINGN